MQHHNRVVADNWGDQRTGNVFCADSSLRYIYENTHVASVAYERRQTLSQARKHSSNNKTLATTRRRDEAWKLALDPQATDQGVDVVEAEIARACTLLQKQEATRSTRSGRACAVCLSTNAVAQIRACMHTFHPSCFLRWYRQNRSCPVCRGDVDKVHVAQPFVAVQCELEAILAESDEEVLHESRLLQCSEANVEGMEEHEEPLRTSSDHLMALLEEDFDADMDLVAFEDLNNHATAATCRALEWELKSNADTKKSTVMEMEDLVMEDEEEGYRQEKVALTPSSDAADAAFLTPQFSPASTIPNYWNVLNQAIVLPIVPPASAVVAHRMVPIAPKPEPRNPLQSQVVHTTQEASRIPSSRASQQIQHHRQHDAVRASPLAASRVVSCRCTGGCRNGRCACVKEGGLCGALCRCTSCKNPFVVVKAAGADIDALLKDDCFMHNVLKTRDMVQRLQEFVAVPCCERTIKMIDCVQGYTCEPCNRRYDFSWCTNKLLAAERTPRNHCAICKRCCDHRDVHCHNCGRCYFAGVAASLPCPCKETSSYKKRRENAAKNKAAEPEEEAEGECCIM